jgi:hypothetical protein
MKNGMKIICVLIPCFILSVSESRGYPIDGYEYSKIKRLLRLQLILDGKISDAKPVKGAQKSINDIKLNLVNRISNVNDLVDKTDPELQKKFEKLFPSKDESYSSAVLDITPGRQIRYAEWKSNRKYSPGSVGKLAILAGLFTELKKIFPDSFEKRIELLKSRIVRAGNWAITNVHTVPFFNPEKNEFFKRTVQPKDEFSLFEWTDHMISVSSNAAASVVWKEIMLMSKFGSSYPPDEAEENAFFSKSKKSELTKIAMDVVNDPLQNIGITKEEWHLGSLFTSEAKRIVPGAGGSSGSPKALIKYLIALEAGKIVDPLSSLEIKRILYLTDRRIRYASSKSLSDAAVYFKSGSLYQCKPEEGFECKKYMGNVKNYMNSVIIVEHPDGNVYLVALMSNVLKKNSNIDHMSLASEIDKIIRK